MWLLRCSKVPPSDTFLVLLLLHIHVVRRHVSVHPRARVAATTTLLLEGGLARVWLRLMWL